MQKFNYDGQVIRGRLTRVLPWNTCHPLPLPMPLLAKKKKMENVFFILLWTHVPNPIFLEKSSMTTDFPLSFLWESLVCCSLFPVLAVTLFSTLLVTTSPVGRSWFEDKLHQSQRHWPRRWHSGEFFRCVYRVPLDAPSIAYAYVMMIVLESPSTLYSRKLWSQNLHDRHFFCCMRAQRADVRWWWV